MQLILHKDTVYEPVESQFYTGHQPVKIVKGEPALSWKGGKISIEEWNKILSFFKWSYDTTKSETQVRLLYHPEQNNWKAWAFPQERGTGMTAKEVDGEEKDKQREMFEGYIVNGTVHHHCSSTAFQSGTDKDNEQSQDGLHITIGKMDSAMYDIHGRVCRSDSMYDCVYKQWFEYPEEWDGVIPERYISHAVSDMLVTPPDDQSFPDQWKENLIEVKRPVATTHWRGNGGQLPMYNRYGATSYPKSKPVVSGFSQSKDKQEDLIPVEYTDAEKEDAAMQVMKEWVDTYGDELKTDAAQIPDLWDSILLHEYTKELSELVTEYGIEEIEFEQYADKLQEKILEKDLEEDNKTSGYDPYEAQVQAHYGGYGHYGV